MARRANNPTKFQTATYDITDLCATETIAQDSLVELTTTLESTGLRAISSGEHKAHYVAERARKMLLKLADIETVPPLTEQHRQQIANSLGHWTMLVEQTAPKPREAVKPPRPTPTAAMRTSAPKA